MSWNLQSTQYSGSIYWHCLISLMHLYLHTNKESHRKKYFIAFPPVLPLEIRTFATSGCGSSNVTRGKSSGKGTDGLTALQRDTCQFQWHFVPGLSTCFHSIKIHFAGSTSIGIIKVKAVWSLSVGRWGVTQLKIDVHSFHITLHPFQLRGIPAICGSLQVLFTCILTSAIVIHYEAHHCGDHF